MPTVFVNYRRDDAAAEARNIRDHLAAAFGHGHVFMDVNDLSPGQRFEDELQKVIGSCQVLIAVIGPSWFTLLTDRLARGDRDHVREEIAAALVRRITVIPVLVGRSGRLPSLPRREDLPPDLQDLVSYQSHAVTHERSERDIRDLAAYISNLHPHAFSRQLSRIRFAIITFVGIAAILSVALFLALKGLITAPISTPGKGAIDNAADKTGKAHKLPASSSSPRDLTPDEAAWLSAERKSLIKYWDAYLDLMPKGKFAPIARERVAKRRDNRLIGHLKIKWPSSLRHGLLIAAHVNMDAEEALLVFTDGKLYRYNWKLESALLLGDYGNVHTFIHAASFSPNANKLAFFGRFPATQGASLTDPEENRVLRVIRVAEPNIVHKLQHASRLRGLAWCGNRELLLSIDYGEHINVWDLNTYTEKRIRRTDAKPDMRDISYLACSPDARFAVTDSYKRTRGTVIDKIQPILTVWDLPNLKEHRSILLSDPDLERGRAGIYGGVFFSDGRRMALISSLTGAGMVLVTLDISSPAEPKIMRFSDHSAESLALSRDERRVALVLGCDISFLDVARGEELYPLGRPCGSKGVSWHRAIPAFDAANEIVAVVSQNVVSGDRIYIFDATGL